MGSCLIAVFTDWLIALIIGQFVYLLLTSSEFTPSSASYLL
ncbi:hypothetical protein GNIT_3236 [Glaciecola nitratireducens FR1064]|uniref:Uncharacterized protein n=1 Tax=Glaciecola nitratireducens (strain JCM 12485 / KCTC 12276 / FR1064) TaxID=1085623 RepID=G4QE56_GLANF|nr:hypothetical protein GNIT_3236 [Glaciecola nitratireducens FR1064]